MSVIGPDVGRLPAPTLDLATQGSFLLPTLQILFGGNLLSNRNRQQTKYKSRKQNPAVRNHLKKNIH